MSKAWSLRYALVRAQLGWEETLAHLTTSTASLPDAIAKGLEVYRKELTRVILFTGIDLICQKRACLGMWTMLTISFLLVPIPIFLMDFTALL